jgi:hypothetical protein
MGDSDFREIQLVDCKPPHFQECPPRVIIQRFQRWRMADVIDLTQKLLQRTVDSVEVEITLNRAFRRLNIVKRAVREMREGGSTDVDIADALRDAADDLSR